MRVIFVGGPADGRKMDLPNNTWSWNFPIPDQDEAWMKMLAENPLIGHRPEPALPMHDAHYRRMERPAGNLIRLFVPFVYEEHS